MFKPLNCSSPCFNTLIEHTVNTTINSNFEGDKQWLDNFEHTVLIIKKIQ